MKFRYIAASVVTGVFLAAAPNAPAQTGAKETGPAAPKLVSAPQPVYPQAVIDARFDGTVRVSVSVDKTGKPTVVDIAGPMAPCSNLDDRRITALREAVIVAAKNAVFEPVIKDGQPVDSSALMTFKLTYPKLPETEQGVPRIVSGGVLNGRAISLGRPSFPDKAREKGVSGSVSVQVLIDERGKIIAADAVSGHPLLRDTAMNAACRSKYSPTTLAGNPVKVSGIITYNFVQ